MSGNYRNIDSLDVLVCVMRIRSGWLVYCNVYLVKKDLSE